MQSSEISRQLIVVLGMHRSGTSAITRALQALGVALGERLEPPAQGINDKGYWEDIDLVALNVEILKVLGRDWHSLESIQPSEVDLLCDRGYLSKALQLLREKTENHLRFGFKDPRTTKLLPFWARVFDAFNADVRFVLAIRNPLSVVRSLEARDNFDPEKSFLLWAEHVVTGLSSLSGRPVITVDYDHVIRNPEYELRRLASWLEADIDVSELAKYCAEFLEKDLRHTHFEPRDVLNDHAAAALVQDIHTFLVAVVEQNAEIADIYTSGSLERWQRELQHMRPALRLLDRLHKRVSGDEIKMASLEQALADDETRIASLEKALAREETRIVALEKILDEQENDLIARVAQIDEQNVQISGLSHAISERDAALAAMLSSSSWRVTAPVRAGVLNFRRVRRALRILPDVVARGGGLRSVAIKGIRVASSEGIAGIRYRLRFVETAGTRGAVEANTTPNGATKLLRVVPHYVDPKLDAQTVILPAMANLAVHLHLFYEDMMPMFVERLANIPYPFDLYVSVSEQSNGEQIAERLRSCLPKAGEIVVEGVPNRGRDLAPLIVQFGQRLAHYDFVGHFHTKKSTHNNRLENWLGDTFDLLLGPSGSTGGRVASLIAMLSDGAKVIYPEARREFIKDRSGWADNYNLARQLLEKYSAISINDFSAVEFPEGSMFWARTECLREFLTLPLTFNDFAKEPIEADGTIAHALERLILIFTSPYEGNNIRLHNRDSIPDYTNYESIEDFSATVVHKDIKILSYYLPQFHPIPENDEWHGKGFTEWTKVRAANPLFRGHYQQHIPHEDIGYYLLDGPDTLRKQAEMMRKSGVYGQIFYHYWFGGKLILEDPARTLLTSSDIDMSFCFCWANENWTRRWDGNESEILLGQNYSSEDARAFIQYLIPFFRDPRYITIGGRPVLFIYRPASIPDIRAYLNAWSDECNAAGLAAPYVIAVLTRGATDPSDFGLDAGTERVLHDWTAGGAPEIKGELEPFQPIEGSVLSYDDVAQYYSSQMETKNFSYFRSIVPMWDNTARYGRDAFVVHGSTPKLFQEWLESLIHYTKQNLREDRRFILVNAWNEWAEGAHLEPDTRHGYAYLNSVGRALSGIPYASQLNAMRELAPGTRLHMSFPPHFRKLLANDEDLAKRFIYCLSRSSVFHACSVTMDAEVAAEIANGATPALPELTAGDAADADFVLEFRRISFFSPTAIEKLVQTATRFRESVIVANGYDGNQPLVAVTQNGSIEATDAHAAPLVIYPAHMAAGGYKNYRMRTDAHCFVAYPNTVARAELPVVTTIIRFHKSGDVNLLRHALLCLAAMHNCICVPLIAAQDLSSEQRLELQALLDETLWWPDFSPKVDEYSSPAGNGDLRSKMLNESLKKVTTRYATFLDYDDLVMSHSYQWLAGRLRKTGKAVSFGRVYSTSYDYRTGVILQRGRTYEYGGTYEEFVGLNHAPLHSFMIDVTRINVDEIHYYEDQRYMEDYYMTLQIFKKENCDWQSLAENYYIGDYIHSVDRSHTLAFAEDSDRQALRRHPDYIICEERINRLRSKLAQPDHQRDPHQDAR